MDTLLAHNDNAALLGDMEGRIHKETRPAELSPQEWQERLRSSYREPEHGYKDDEGVPYRHSTGGYAYDQEGRMVLQFVEGVKPYETFTDEASGLSLRYAFLAYGREWHIADLEEEREDDF